MFRFDVICQFTSTFERCFLLFQNRLFRFVSFCIDFRIKKRI
nr:MAG TPA: hypothetical protein [Caudoviricetes sp.]